MYETRKAALKLLEEQDQLGNIDLYYGDETKVSEEGYVPYGWQFDDENIAIEVSRGASINVFGLLSKNNHLIYKMTSKSIDSNFIMQTLDTLSLSIEKLTVIVLDNASAHTARKVKELFEIWQKRGLYIFYLPPYSPHLNIIERFWKELKQGWIKPDDYKSADNLFYAVDRICANFGSLLNINFSKSFDT